MNLSTSTYRSNKICIGWQWIGNISDEANTASREEGSAEAALTTIPGESVAEISKL